MTNDNDIETLTDLQLDQHYRSLLEEKLRRSDLAKQAKKAVRLVNNKFILDNLHIFLRFVEHSRLSCSDEQPSNCYENCPRCVMLNMKKVNFIRDCFKFSLNIEEVEDEDDD